MAWRYGCGMHMMPHVVGMVSKQDDMLRGKTITVGNGTQ